MTDKLFHTQYLSLADALYKVAFYIWKHSRMPKTPYRNCT